MSLRLLGILAPLSTLMGAALSISPPAQPALPGTEVVAVVERRSPRNQVETRRVLTREQFDELLRQRARELTTSTGGLPPWLQEISEGEEGEDSEQEAAPSSDLTDQEGIAGALGLTPSLVIDVSGSDAPPEEPQPEEEDLSVDELMTMAREAQEEDEPWIVEREEATIIDEEEVPRVERELQREGDSFRSLPPDLQRMITSPFADPNSQTRRLEEQVATIRLRQTEDPAERQLRIEMLRLQRRFERQVIAEWVESALLSLEAERQGHTVTEADIDTALLPMLQARLHQINRLEQEGQEELSSGDIQRLRQTAEAMETSGAAVISLDSRRTLRSEIADILAAQGVDTGQFYDELRDRILADKLIRSLIYEVYGEQRLREYHSAHQEEFVIPRRFQNLSVKYHWRLDELPEERGQIREAFEDLQRRLRRIDEDTPLDEVVQEWEESLQDLDDLPDRTYLALTRPQLLTDMPSEIAQATVQLNPGETSDVVDVMPEAIQGGSGYAGGLAIVRLVDFLESSGWEFEEVRPRVEDVFFEDTRTYLVNLLEEQGPYREWTNSLGAPLTEVIEDLRDGGNRTVR